MAAKLGLSKRIVAWVAKNPGRNARELGAALDFEHNGGMLAYMRSKKLLWVAGPRQWQRYFATESEASEVQERVSLEAKEERQRRQEATARAGSLRSKLARAMVKAEQHGMPKARIVVRPAVVDRYATPVVPPMFSGLGPGRYLPNDSAIARAYAQEQSA